MRKVFLVLCACLILLVPVSGQMDYGDAPDPPYPSLKESNGSRHVDFTSALLGERVNGEMDSRQVNEDDYDDAFLSISPFRVLVTNNDHEGELYLNVLLDTNQDGDWEDSGEWVLRNEEVNVPEGESEEVVVPVNLSAEIWLNAGLRGSTETNISTWVRTSLTAEEIPSYSGHGRFEIGETEDRIFRLHARNQSPTCGNWIIEAGEMCDPPQPRPCPGAGQLYCNNNCQLVQAQQICGDGCKEGAEQCDLAGKAPGKPPKFCKPGQGFCNNNCKCVKMPPPPQNTTCGNNELEKGEECEQDKHCGAGEVCTDTCICEEESTCGNAEVEKGEECETDSDCPAAEMCNQETCQCEEGVTTAFCGNDRVERAEDCENDADCGEGEVCTEECNCIPEPDEPDEPGDEPEPRCGNGMIEEGEACENNAQCAEGEVCQSCNCIDKEEEQDPTCGNGIVEEGEACDPPEGPSCPTGERFCNSNCQWEVWTQSCGDGCVEGQEQCDLGQNVKGADPVHCEGDAQCMGCECVRPEPEVNLTVNASTCGPDECPRIDPVGVDFDATVTGGEIEDGLDYEWDFGAPGETEADRNESGGNASRNKSPVFPSFIGDRFELRLRDQAFGVVLEDGPRVTELGSGEEFSAPAVVKTDARTVNRIIDSDDPPRVARAALKNGKIDIQGKGLANQVRYGMLEAFGRIGMKYFQDNPYDVRAGEEKTVMFEGKKATLKKNELGQKVVDTGSGDKKVINDNGEVMGSIPDSTERLVNDRPQDCSGTAGVYTSGSRGVEV